jgi:protein phosphatase PTC1
MAKHFKFQECGTTVAAALIRPRDARGNRLLHVANVGDSRVVLSDNGKAVRLTKDHNLKLTSEVHRVRQEGGVVFNGRVNGQLAVSRALGDHSLKSSGVSAVPDQMHVVLQPRHRLLIIACDGLWDVVTDQQAVQALELLHDERDAVEMAKVLVDMAIQRGTTDNVSVMVVLLRQ